MNSVSNPCWRCGKERIFVKSWEEKIGYSVVITTETACPDPDCQKIVDRENKKQQDRYEASQLKRKTSLKRNGKKIKN